MAALWEKAHVHLLQSKAACVVGRTGTEHQWGGSPHSAPALHDLHGQPSISALQVPLFCKFLFPNLLGLDLELVT